MFLSNTSQFAQCRRGRQRNAARGFTLLEIMIVLVIIGTILGVLVGPRIVQMFSGSKVELTKTMVKLAAHQAYSQWSIKNPTEQCPKSLSDIQQYMNNPQKELKDSWGNLLVMLCGDQAPQGAGTPFAIYSLGPDGKQGTDDDIKSWE